MTGRSLHDQFGVSPRVQAKQRLKLASDVFFHFLRCIRKELGSGRKLPLRESVRAWKHGFSTDLWDLYRLQGRDPVDYLPDLSGVFKMGAINGAYNAVVGEKLILSYILDALGVPQPDVVSAIFNGRLFARDPGAAASQKEMLDLTLERYPRQILRPTWAGAGTGIFMLERNDRGLSVNNRPATVEQVFELISSLQRYVSTAWVKQAEYAHSIFPGAVNTMRVLTLWDEDAGPYVAALSHRFGSARSGFVDNFHQGHGGLCAPINIRDSKLEKAATRDAKGDLVFLSGHPDTGAAIEGVTVTGLAACLEHILTAANGLPFCPCMGWDIAMTDSGYLVLEINPVPGMAVWQVHQPLLSDPKTRRFFERHGVVRPVTGAPG